MMLSTEVRRDSDRLRVVAADDEPRALQLLIAALAPVADVVATATDGRSALEAISRTAPDVVILDVEMPSMSGLEVAARAKRNAGPEVVILSAFDGYAVGAFEIEAIDYLVKPLREERLIQALERVRRRRRGQATHHPAAHDLAARDKKWRPGDRGPGNARIHIPGRHGGVYLALADIVWIEAARDYALLHTPTRTHILRATMAALARRLPETMLRVHRSAFVALDQVAGWGPSARGIHSLVLLDGTKVTVGASYYRQVAEALRDRGSG